MSRATRKRSLLSSHKPRLLFVEQPRSGSRHDYGPQLRSAVNPRSFVSEQSRQGASHQLWVSPQFTLLEDTAVRCGGQNKRKKKNHLPTSTFNGASLSTQVRRPAVCRYPALLFDPGNSAPLRCHRSLGKKRPESCVSDLPQSNSVGTISAVSRDDTQKTTSHNIGGYNVSTSAGKVTPPHTGSTARKLTTQGPVVTHNSTPDSSSVLTPPHIQTPEMPCHEPHDLSPVLNILFSSNQPRTPPRTENISLLVQDTPEHDYGLKVTWRRRKKLMRLLTERGQLLSTEAMISKQ